MDASLNVSLPQSLKEWLERRAIDGGFGTTDEVLHDLIRKEQEREQRAKLDQHLLNILNGPPARPMTSADWQRIRDEGGRRVARRP